MLSIILCKPPYPLSHTVTTDTHTEATVTLFSDGFEFLSVLHIDHPWNRKPGTSRHSRHVHGPLSCHYLDSGNVYLYSSDEGEQVSNWLQSIIMAREIRMTGPGANIHITLETEYGQFSVSTGYKINMLIYKMNCKYSSTVSLTYKHFFLPQLSFMCPEWLVNFTKAVGKYVFQHLNYFERKKYVGLLCLNMQI